MPKNPKDTDTSLEGSKSSSEDHQAQTKEKRKFVIKQEKEEYR